MSMLHKPTPPPWHYEQDESDELNIYRSTNNTGVIIATLFSDPMDEETHANAAFIITSVNHHQELVTRLSNLVNALDLMGSPDYNTSSIFESIETAQNEARETLKKVIQ